MNYFDRSPVPLRADHGAMIRETVTALARAAISVAHRARSPETSPPWANDKAVQLLTRATVAPTTTANAAALIQISYRLVAALTPVSAAAALVERSLQLQFDGTGNISVPSLRLATSGFVAEASAIPVINGISAAGATLAPFSLKSIVTLTNELIDGGNAETLVAQVLVENLAAALDAALLSNAAAVAGLRPPGLFNGITPLTPTATGQNAMIGDLAKLAATIAPVAGTGSPVLLAAFPQAVALQALAVEHWPVFASSALASGTIAAVVPEALGTVIETPILSAGRETTLQFEDATPATDISTGAPNRSLFQINSTALRVVTPVAWALRDSRAAAWITAANWP